MQKKIWLIVSLTVLLAVLFCLAAGAETYNGTCGAVDDGSNLTWTLNTETGELAISGTGRMKNYSDTAKAPWSAYSASIKTLTVNAGVTTIGKLAFEDCSALTVASLPAGLTSISNGAFKNCSAMGLLTLPSTLTSINYGAFQGCSSLTKVTLPEGLTVLEGKAFEGCSALTEINIPVKVTEIKWGTFEGCAKLKEIEFPANVKVIDAFSFKDCKALTEIVVPETVKYLGTDSFNGCTSLKSIKILSKTMAIGGAEGTIPAGTTIYAEPNSGASKYVEAYNKTAVIACTHKTLVETVLVKATCTKSGIILESCADCEYEREIIVAPTHADTAVDSTLGFTEYTCILCGDKGMIIKAGDSLELSAFCEGTLSFSLVAASADDIIEVLVDGESIGNVTLDANGKGTVVIESLAHAGHTVEFVNKSAAHVRIKNTAIDGYFHRADTVYEEGAVYVEMLGKDTLDYSDFYVYVRTSDASKNYYVRYKFDYIYNDAADSYMPNTCTNISSYRLNGADLVKVTNVGDTQITSTIVYTVLGGGEVSLALRWLNPDWTILPESLNTSDYIFTAENSNKGTVIEHIGGFHGDEWLSAVSLVADDQVIDLKTSEAKVIPCSSILFDLTTTMYAWGTSYKTESEYYRGLAFAEHVQNFAINAGGINHMQSVEFLIDNFKVTGYMPMFTMMRGSLNDRFIDTMRSYDADNNLVDVYVMDPAKITSQTNVLADWAGTSVAAYEYDGSKGVSARIDFREANDELHLGAYIAMRTENGVNSADNKMYAPISTEIPALGEVWMVESHYMIDYDSAKIQ
ncbi:MAG: leucine-rich repeat domain-containing protein [Clostridia bacterium]|nr:leucine-rich repeat domain-containing protein [Clostridia bacterium]